MRTIIAGSRNINNNSIVQTVVTKAARDHDINISVLVCGMAKGVDMLGHRWATANNIKIDGKPANWELHGKRAGYFRNVQMAENADALIAIWDGKSPGTKHMIDIAKARGLKVVVYQLKPLYEPEI